MKGKTGSSTSTIIYTDTIERKKRREKKDKIKKENAEKCKICQYNDNGFCSRWKHWCAQAFITYCKIPDPSTYHIKKKKTTYKKNKKYQNKKGKQKNL